MLANLQITWTAATAKDNGDTWTRSARRRTNDGEQAQPSSAVNPPARERRSTRGDAARENRRNIHSIMLYYTIQYQRKRKQRKRKHAHHLTITERTPCFPCGACFSFQNRPVATLLHQSIFFPRLHYYKYASIFAFSILIGRSTIQA